jgi:antitoxin component YwqK of YwqJK toxin-antitoxin module
MSGAREQHIEYHKDGSIHAKGERIDGVLEGFWEWFRLDGTRMRSGYFRDGRQAGEWTTYDRRGEVVKVTSFDGKAPASE